MNKLNSILQTIEGHDDEWDTGSVNLDKAIEMLKAISAEYPDALISVIDKASTNPFCLDEITVNDIND